MTTYVYALRGGPKSTATIRLQDGSEVEAGRISYLFKPSSYDHDGGEQRIYDRIEYQIGRTWGDERPAFVIVKSGKERKLKTGDLVLRWGDREFVYDDPNYQGLEQGYLVPDAHGGFYVGCRKQVEWHHAIHGNLGAAIAQTNGCTLTRNSSYFILKGYTGEHHLHIPDTDIDRLRAHWGGFVQRNYKNYCNDPARHGRAGGSCSFNSPPTPASSHNEIYGLIHV